MNDAQLKMTQLFNFAFRYAVTLCGLASSWVSAYALSTITINAPQEAQTLGAHATTRSAYFETVAATQQPPVTTYFDKMGKPIRVSKTGYNDVVTHTDTLYDSAGRVVAVSVPYTGAAATFWTYTSYDDFGRVEEVVTPAFGSTESDLKSTTTTTDYHGRVTQVTVNAHDRSAQITTTLVNTRGEAIKIWNADNVPTNISEVGAGMGNASLGFKLDGRGRMRETTMKGITPKVSATYDALGNQATLNDPDKGLWSYEYNGLGQMVQQTNAKQDVTEIEYDYLGRVLTRSIDEGGNGTVDEQSDFYYWDDAEQGAFHHVGIASGGWIGALQRIDQETFGSNAYQHSVAYHYDDKGRLMLDLHSVDDKQYYFYTDYDAYSRVMARSYFWRPKGWEGVGWMPGAWNFFGVYYDYNNASYITKVRDSMNRTWFEAHGSLGYDYLDRPHFFRKGDFIWTKRYYDEASGLMSRIDIYEGIPDTSYTWDGLGNLGSRTSGDDSESFTYDNLNRLTHRNYNGSSQEIAQYDTTGGNGGVGNIVKKRDVDGNWINNYVYNSSSKPHAVRSFTQDGVATSIGYDANGNMSSRSGNGQTWSFSWTAYDKPKHISNGSQGSAFLYDANQQRAVHLKYKGSSSAPNYTQKKLYIGSNFEADFENLASGTSEDWHLERMRIYIDGPDGRTGAFEFEGDVDSNDDYDAYVYHTDHLGSVEFVTEYGSAAYANDRAGKSSRNSYDAWGQRRDRYNWDQAPRSTHTQGGEDGLSPRGYTNHEMLDELGLVHMNGRIYDPLLGRFLSADQKVDGVMSLQGFNRYSYVHNNPLSNFDPDGYESVGAFNAMQTELGILGRWVGAMTEFFVGGKTEVNTSSSSGLQLATDFSGPEGGIGGVAGGIAEAATLRMTGIGEDNPSALSAGGMEIGAAMVPIVDGAQSAITGETVTGRELSATERVIAGGAAVVEGAAIARLGKATVVTEVIDEVPTQLQKNAEQGKAFEQVVGDNLSKTESVVAEQVTVKAQNGVSTRLDFASKSQDGTVSLTEAKSSATAPLTKNQKAAFPEIEKTGGVVTGKGKPGFEGGTQIPATKVRVVRPEDL